MSQNVSFNLVDEPWIRVRSTDGEEREVSLLELFEQAAQIKCLANDLPTQDFAILRVLLAILQRAISPTLDDDDDPAEVWGGLWSAPEFPIDAIREYLEKWRYCFDLFDEERPFMQVADLRMLNEKMRGSGVWKIIADVPDGDPLFSLRTAKETLHLSFSEAARWLVHVQAYDTSGIKSATVGDSLALSGRRTSLGIDGVGWLGRLGGVYFEGNTLRETLLLNLIVRDVDNLDLFSDDDEPFWEKDGGDMSARSCSPSGRADLYTWQSRKVRLIPEGERVVDVILTYGDMLKLEDARLFEPMTAWCRGRGKAVNEIQPCTHRFDSALWRGLDSLFGGALVNDTSSFLRPDLVEWLAYLSSENGGRWLDWSRLLKMHAVGFKYDKNLSTIVDAVDDKLELNSFLLSKEGESLVVLVEDCASSASSAVMALGELVDNLRLASGCCSTVERAKRDKAAKASLRASTMERGFYEVGSRFRTWIAGLGEDSDIEAVRAEWRRDVRKILNRIAADRTSEIGSAAIAGAPVKDKKGKVIGWMTMSKAWALFNNRLRKALPLEEDAEMKKEAR